MEFDYEFILGGGINLANYFLNSGFFLFIKFILAIYVIVLFVDIVLLLAVRGVGGDIRSTLMGALMPLATKKTIQKRWVDIENRLNFNTDEQNKAAILEADKLVDEILFSIGYKGSNMRERLDNADSCQIEEIELLIEAHEVRNKIIYDSKFNLEKDDVTRIMNIYRDFMDNLGII